MNPYKIAAIVVLVSLMLATGMQCDRQRLIAALRNHWLLGRALLANFVIVPLIAVVTVRGFQVSMPVATGILLMAIAPGAPFLTRSAGTKSGGSLGFAVALAFLMPALSILTIPITAGFVLPPGAQAHLPWVPFVVKLVALQLVPLLIGMFVADRAPALATKLQKWLGLILLAAILVVAYHLGPLLVKAFFSVQGSHGIGAMLVVVVLAIGTGWLFGGARREFRRTLSIGTGVRNFGLGVLIATTNFDDKLVSATVMTYFLIQFIVTTCVRLYLQRSAHDADGEPAAPL
jgi:bile acid:Na+ symporter, BASS family